MSDTVWLALFALLATFIGSLPALMTAYAGLKQSQKNAQATAANTLLTEATSQKVEETNKKVEETNKKVDDAALVTEEIKVATNGGMSEVKGQLQAVTTQNAAMQLTIKTLSEVITARNQDRKRETGELVTKVEEVITNGNQEALAAELKALRAAVEALAEKT